LHDETLQQLAGLRVLLGGARRSGDAERIAGALDEAVEMITTGIADLRALITDLRPAALDELGLEAALRTLAERVGRQSDLSIELDVNLAWERGDHPSRHLSEVESAGYRTVQEALTNVVKHAGATRVQITLRDDGAGFEPEAATSGFGLVGMRERIALVHGSVDIESEPGKGTTIRARIPGRRREAAAPLAAR
jgi:signal transduction histidine kinase